MDKQKQLRNEIEQFRHDSESKECTKCSNKFKPNKGYEKTKWCSECLEPLFEGTSGRNKK